MVEEWISLADYKKIPILNIDLNSDDKNKFYGESLCEKKIALIFLHCDGTEMQKNYKSGLRVFSEKNMVFPWVLYTCITMRSLCA